MKKIVEMLMIGFFIVMILAFCLIDSESAFPFVLAGISIIGIVGCNVYLSRRRT